MFEKFSGSGQCHICNRSIGTNGAEAYLISNALFQLSKPFRQWIITNGLATIENQSDYIFSRYSNPMGDQPVCFTCARDILGVSPEYL